MSQSDIDEREMTFDELDELPCSWCGGEGLCWDGSDPLGSCPDEPHPCHACCGGGRVKDQWLF
jgi:hypothetical protein